MAEVLKEVREGRFARELMQEEETGYPRLDAARAQARESKVERTFAALREIEK
jgi:ketol-acid reductoisomerase